MRVDADQFSGLAKAAQEDLRAGRNHAAKTHLGVALGLWRGPAYADVGDVACLRQEVSRLEELRWTVRENLLSARLALGEHETVLHESEELVAAQPLRERGWYLRTLALYRCNRQSEALAALRDVQDVLRAEIGSEPGPLLRRLLNAILRHEPWLDWVPAMATLPVEAVEERAMSTTTRSVQRPDDIIGRDRDLSAVSAALRDSSLVTVTGPPGIGKSRLVQEVAHLWPSPATCVLTTCSPLAVEPPTALLQRAEPGRAGPLLVLDEGGHHDDDATAALVGEWATLVPGARILVTASRPLGLPGEVTYELGPLRSLDDSVALMISRLHMIRPHWNPGSEDLPAITEICRFLQGHPLAVELTAAWTRMMSLSRLLQQLRKYPDLLAPSSLYDTVTAPRPFAAP